MGSFPGSYAGLAPIVEYLALYLFGLPFTGVAGIVNRHQYRRVGSRTN